MLKHRAKAYYYPGAFMSRFQQRTPTLLQFTKAMIIRAKPFPKDSKNSSLVWLASLNVYLLFMGAVTTFGT